ncbi:MAG: hypothetical protein K5906_01105 [Bacilli bacterium]|nr:hypothetical protein [Bacilli bacterium]
MNKDNEQIKRNEVPQNENQLSFQNIKPLEKGKKVERYQDKLPGAKYRKWNVFVTVLGIIASAITIMYYFLPIFSALIGGIIVLILGIFVVFAVLGTLFISLLIEGFRNWIVNDFMTVPNFFFNITNNIGKLMPYYPTCAFPAMGLCVLGLILAIIGRAKKFPRFTALIVLNSIFLVVVIGLTILYYATGGQPIIKVNS